MNHVVSPHIEYINLMLDEKRAEAAKARQRREARQNSRRVRGGVRRGLRRRLRPAAA